MKHKQRRLSEQVYDRIYKHLDKYDLQFRPIKKCVSTFDNRHHQHHPCHPHHGHPGHQYQSIDTHIDDDVFDVNETTGDDVVLSDELSKLDMNDLSSSDATMAIDFRDEFDYVSGRTNGMVRDHIFRSIM